MANDNTPADSVLCHTEFKFKGDEREIIKLLLIEYANSDMTENEALSRIEDTINQSWDSEKV